jgi:hypothetical protein
MFIAPAMPGEDDRSRRCGANVVFRSIAAGEFETVAVSVGPDAGAIERLGDGSSFFRLKIPSSWNAPHEEIRRQADRNYFPPRGAGDRQSPGRHRCDGHRLNATNRRAA